MKKITRIVSLVLAIVLFSAMFCMPSFAKTKTVTTKAQCNLRSGPSLKWEILDTIPKGSTMEYYSTSTDKRGVLWYNVYWEGDYGWVSSANIKQSGTYHSKYKTVLATGDTYIRTNPNKTSSKLTVLKSGKKATYLKYSRTDSRGVRWYKVSYKGVTGWVSSMFTELC